MATKGTTKTTRKQDAAAEAGVQTIKVQVITPPPIVTVIRVVDADEHPTRKRATRRSRPAA